MDKDLTICIVHYNKINKLQNTIEHIQENTSCAYMVKILNNGYTDEAIESYLSKISSKKNIEIIFNEENIGCSPGRNKLLNDINTPYVMTLDDDMYVCKGWFEKARSVFRSNPKIGVIGFPFVQNNIYSQSSSRVGGGYLSLESSVLSVESINWNQVDDSNEYISVDYIPGGSMLMRNEVLSDFEWDSRYKIGFDDLDVSLQLSSSKWDLAMIPDYDFKHDVSSNEDYQKVRRDYHERRKSYQLFREKWNCRYDLKKHLIFNYLFALPWPVMNKIERLYQSIAK